VNTRRMFLAGSSALMAHTLFPQVLHAFVSSAITERPYRSRLFGAVEMHTLKALVDVILPATDSPAASTALTHVFVDFAAAACATPAAQAMLHSGLEDLNQESQKQYGARFADLGADLQALLLAPRALADTADPDLPYDQSFFRIVKDYTMTGYFNSPIGATQALAYDKIPGGYVGDVPLLPGQKAWAAI
jgi:gluconate 2-dehydrogenase gamma chain